MAADGKPKQRTHRVKHAGLKTERREKKKKKLLAEQKDLRENSREHSLSTVPSKNAERNNPKAFTFTGKGKAEKAGRRNLDLGEKKLHVPQVDRTPLAPPPVIVAVVGPAGSGKTTLIKSLVRRYTKQTLSDINGPVTVVSGKKRRLTFMECANDMNSMIDMAKIADLVLLLVDASYGFEMETFEFLNILQVHGLPKIMGVLTHLDAFRNNKTLRTTKKRLKQRFWTEIYQGAKLFYLSGVLNGRYPDQEIMNLSRFISVMKFRPLMWRNTHPYLLADRVEDLTQPADVHRNPKCDRTVTLYGYLRGTNFKRGQKIHIPGVGDFSVDDVSILPDPCPLAETVKRRLSEKQKLIYAPMSDVGGVMYDKDAVYINVPGTFVKKQSKEGNGGAEEDGPQAQGERMVIDLQDTDTILAEKLEHSGLRLFTKSVPVTSAAMKSLLEPESNEELAEDVESSEGLENLSEFDNDDVSEDDEDVLSETEDCESDEDGDKYMESGDDGGSDGQVTRVPAPVSTGRRPAVDKYISRSLRSKFDDRTSTVITSSIELESNEELAEDVESSEGDGNLSEFDYDDVSEDDEHVLSETEDFESAGDEDGGKCMESGDDGGSDDEVTGAKATVSAGCRPPVDNYISPSLRSKFDDRTGGPTEAGSEEPMADENAKESDCEDLFFKVKEVRKGDEIALKADTTKSYWEDQELDVWKDEEVLESLRDRFITGNLDAVDGGVKTARDEEGEEYGDFEDLETGKKISAAEPQQQQEAASLTPDEELAKKRTHLKRKFDAEYDGEDVSDGEKLDFYEAAKSEIAAQLGRNREEFQEEDSQVRALLEGFRPGTYVRLLLRCIPCEFVRCFDPAYPIIIGGLSNQEENLGFIQVRIKRHRWHKKTLKNNDPLIFSLGWRRFQSTPLFSLYDGTHNRMLKYTPEHTHCLATFWGPITPPNTGFCAVQSVRDNTPYFRISATGVVLDIDQSVQVVKKLKLTGVPHKIFRNTAFIKNMFTSNLEVAKFEGATIRTVSGIRGQVKKPVAKPEGYFRATFEDKILMSDTVFLRAWCPVKPRKFYNPVTSLLLSSKTDWQGLKLTGEIRREQSIPTPTNPDSAYKPIERPTRRFNPLRIPKSLQGALPFKSKAKVPMKRKRPGLLQKRAVVMDAKERKIASLLQAVRTLRADKARKRKEKKTADREAALKKKAKVEEIRERKEKERRKDYFRKEGRNAS